jgi:CheY-like chemotaxis protein
MPAQIVLVHDVEDFATETATGLRNVGYEVAVFTDPNAALDALEAAETVELLITRVNFPAGKPNGVSLALMTRTRRPNIRVIFAAVAETEHTQRGLVSSWRCRFTYRSSSPQCCGCCPNHRDRQLGGNAGEMSARWGARSVRPAGNGDD